MAQAQASPKPLPHVDISVLERTAEDISSAASANGSDIGVEIRRIMSAERSRSRSSRSASGSSNNNHHHHHHHQQHQHSAAEHSATSVPTRPRRISSIRSRATSNSYANSVSDARMGITSPASMHSAFEPLQEGRPLDSPLAPAASMRSAPSQYSNYSQDPAVSRRVSQSSLAFSYTPDHAISRQASQSSFAQRWDGMVSQIEEQLQTIPHSPASGSKYRPPVVQEETHEDQHARDVAEGSTPERPHSSDTFQQAEFAFRDFDGVHFNPATEEFVAVDDHGNEVRRVSARTSSGSLVDAAQVLRTRPGSSGAGLPMPRYPAASSPQESGMVYYPAPVPRMLNLPKRLSQLPSATVQAKRRTQIANELDNVPQEEVAPTIPKLDFDETEETIPNRSISDPLTPQQQQQPEQTRPGMLNQRRSLANMRNLPPQLRATLYFEQPSIPHHVQVKHESAVATLDSILEASATAPVSAFTDHPYAGDVRKSVYGMEKPLHSRKNTSTTLPLNAVPPKEIKKNRSSSIGNFFRRSSGDLLDNESKRPSSRLSQMFDGEGGKKLQKRKSQLSMADALERERTLQELEGQSGLVAQAANSAYLYEEEEALHRASSHPHDPADESARLYTDGEQIAEDFREQEALSDVDETDPIFAQPATLLAELQVRKAQMKNRTRTAATAYPNGMHSTLLQLDAVEQINKKKRQKQRIALAWEDPHQMELDEETNEDEDVPLGVLYPNREGTKNGKTGDSRDWNRPLGLMEQREMEDSEPLSRRADRLNPVRAEERRAMRAHQRRVSQMQMQMQMADEDEERKMREREVLDGALADVVPKDGSRPASTFSADVLSQFGGLNVKDAAETAEAADEEEEETLGQRRARLQRERSVSGEVNGTPRARPALRSTNSMANLLSSNPVRAPVPARAGWESNGQQGLLQISAANQARQKAGLREANSGRVSVMGLGAMGGGGGVVEQGKSIATPQGMLGGVSARPANGFFVPTPGANVGFASPTAAVVSGLGYANAPPPYGQQQMGMAMQGMSPQQFNASAYYALAGASPMMSGFPTQQAPLQMQYGYGIPGVQGMSTMGQNGSQAQQPGYTMNGLNGMNGMNGMELPLDPNQRAAIDRWRMGIA